MNYIEKYFNNCRYYKFGKGKKLYVLLSGWGTPFSLADMYNLAINLSLTSKVIVIDRPGYDKHDSNVSNRSFENVCLEISEVIKHEGNGEKVVIVGHSLGGAYGLFLAEKYPQLVEEVVSLDMLPYTGNFASLIYGINYLPAYTFCFLRKTKILLLLKDTTLEKALRLDNIPEEVSSKALIRTHTSLYNKYVMSELKYMKAFIKRLKKGEIVSRVPVKIIISESTFNATKKYLSSFEQMYLNVTLINIGKSSHYIHHDKLNDVINNILE